MKKPITRLKDYIADKAVKLLGLVDSQLSQDMLSDVSMFTNDYEQIQRTKLKEYNVWYNGDSDELLAFYTKQNMLDYNYEPYFDRNKQNYFWAISSTEGNIKRTHSGQPRNIVDTLVNIIGMPKISARTEKATKNLTKILDANNFTRMLIQKSRPMTFVEGWGCYKINWNKSLSDKPILVYYRAENVDVICKQGIIVAYIFKDYYYDNNGKKYLVIETRSRGKSQEDDGNTYPCLYIHKEAFICGTDDTLVPTEFSNIPQLSDVTPFLKISNYSGLLAELNVYYEDVETELPGRSIFTGKIDMFDDLDQCLSQSSNTIRKSTPHEYFDTNYLERDRDTGMPIMPKAFDRSYTKVTSPKDANGMTPATEPVVVTQPRLDTSMYDNEAVHILIQCINGIMSPATLGIDIAKKDNADAQREKEKVTIFTRNTVLREESKTLSKLCAELLCAEEIIRTGKCTYEDYEIQVQYDEYADSSWEAKSQSLLMVYNAGVMSPEMFVKLLWGDTISKEDADRELEFIKEQLQMQMTGGMPPEMMAAMGAQMGGMNPYDAQMATPGPEAGINMLMQGNPDQVGE